MANLRSLRLAAGEPSEYDGAVAEGGADSRDETEVVHSSDPARLDPGTWEPSLTHRLRVLLHTFPLHDMRKGDALRDPELRHYDSVALALRVVALVIDHMGLEREVDRSMAARTLEPLLTAMDEAAGVESIRDRHAQMLERVLAGLRNDAERRRPFETEYIELGPDGRAVGRRLEFRLLVDHHHPDGGTVLRLSSEAINLFLQAFELDIEDAQAAAEAVVQSQLARGRFSEALQSARNARLQSLRYHERIHRILRDTRRDIGSVDWKGSVPALLDDALAHLKARLAVEASILEVANERLDRLPDGDAATRQVADIATLVKDCRVRHAALQDPLMRARNVFLDEQARQGFRRPALVHRPELFADVVTPVLRLPIAEAVEVATTAASTFLGTSPPTILSLRTLVLWQLRPRQERRDGDVSVVAADLVTRGTDLARFPPEVVEAAQAVLDQLPEPSKLSDLLRAITGAEAAGPDRQLAEVVALLALHHFAPDGTDAPPVRVERHGAESFQLDHLYGDELWIEPLSGRDDAMVGG